MKAIRADDKRPMGFDLYCHMLVNNIGGLDDVCESRSCKHCLMKCPDSFEAPEIENEVDKWQADRDALYLCGLLHWQEVKASYDSLEEKSLKNRALEIDKATLAVAKLIGPEVYAKVLGYITNNNSRRKMADLENDWVFHAIKWWKSHAIDQWKSAGDCAEEIAGDCLNVQADSPFFKKDLKSLAWQIGKALSRYPVVETRMFGGTKQYKMNEKNWNAVAKARGYEQCFNLIDFMPTITTIPTIPTMPTMPTISTISTTKEAQNGLENGGHGGHGGLGGDKGGKPSPPDLPWLQKKTKGALPDA